MRTLVTGGKGRLATALKPYLEAYYFDKDEFDVTYICNRTDWDLVVHLAAYTLVDKAETEREECFKTNVYGTYALLDRVRNTPIVFMSTEHVNAPGVYFESKLAGEIMVRNLASPYLIIRTLFKPSPWPWEYAFTDQMTQGDYLEVIAPLIAKEIKEWNRESKTVYVGTGRKSIFELAKRTKPDVKPNSVNDLALKRPHDYL
jgi:dTDP-4-dehydrorhamnose reductase